MQSNVNAATVQAIAAAVEIRNLAAFNFGVRDGYEQGFELSRGMSYDAEPPFEGIDPEVSQWEYDLGTYVGACLAVRPLAAGVRPTLGTPEAKDISPGWVALLRCRVARGWDVTLSDFNPAELLAEIDAR